MSRYYRKHHYILDPHTAVGIKAAEIHRDQGVPVVCLATAHPAKFVETVEKAIGRQPDLPPQLDGLSEKPARCEIMECSAEKIMAYIEENGISAP
jgi:threonine synthase